MQTQATTCHLVLGDAADHMTSLESATVDLVLTDPPYNLGAFMQGRQTNLAAMRANNFVEAGWDNHDYSSWLSLMDKFLGQTARVLKRGGSCVIFMAVIKVETLIQLAESHGLYYKTTGVWHKTNPMPRNMNLHFVNSTESWIYFTMGTKTGTFNNRGKVLHDHVSTGLTPSSEKVHGKHPTQKPVKLMEHFIEVLTHKNDLVLDPFMGSGSSAVAAKKLHRNYIGIELDLNYYQLTEKRVRALV